MVNSIREEIAARLEAELENLLELSQKSESIEPNHDAVFSWSETVQRSCGPDDLILRS